MLSCMFSSLLVFMMSDMTSIQNRSIGMFWHNRFMCILFHLLRMESTLLNFVVLFLLNAAATRCHLIPSSCTNSSKSASSCGVQLRAIVDKFFWEK